MRSLEFLAAALAFSLCLTAVNMQYHKSLHLEKTVQAFYPSDNSAILRKTAHGGVEYLNKIIFLGDSRTYGLKAFSMLDGGENTDRVWTPRNGTMSVWDMQYQKVVYPPTDAELTCAEAAAIQRPEILLISLGFNGFEMVKKEYFMSEYTKLIASVKEASPDTTIILQSMFPVCRSYTLISNEKILEGNNWILQIAENTNSYYLNTAEVLCDEEGYLIEEYSTDGCHLTPLGLDIQIEYICTHMIGGD